MPPPDVPLDPTAPPGAIPAATLILMRPAPAAAMPGAMPDEVLLLRRAKSMVFAAGAAVFPGGRIEADDAVAARISGGDAASPWAAAAAAAIRETVEEAGVVAGWPGLAAAAPAEQAEVRAALLAGTPLSAILAARAEALALAELVPFAHWCPNFRETRAFDTYFFAAAVAADARATVMAAEHSACHWASAADMLADAAEGRHHIIFPTARNLERLARYPDFSAVAAHARATPIRRITPWVADVGGAAMLCIPDDLGYPQCRVLLDRVSRGGGG